MLRAETIQGKAKDKKMSLKKRCALRENDIVRLLGTLDGSRLTWKCVHAKSYVNDGKLAGMSAAT